MLEKGFLFLGGKMSFEDLIERLGSKLRAITVKLNGKYTAFDHDDLYQEALLSLWEKHKKGELEDKTDSYILQGCFFFLKNYIRKIYKRIDSCSRSLNGTLNDRNETFDDILTLAVKGDCETCEENLFLEDIFSHLGEREKKIVSLSMDNFTTREIGKCCGISHAMVVKIKKKVKSRCRSFREEII